MNTYTNPSPYTLRLYLNGYLQGIFPRNEQGLYQARTACYIITSAVLLGQFCQTEFDIQRNQHFIEQQASVSSYLDSGLPVEVNSVGLFTLH